MLKLYTNVGYMIQNRWKSVAKQRYLYRLVEYKGKDCDGQPNQYV